MIGFLSHGNLGQEEAKPPPGGVGKTSRAHSGGCQWHVLGNDHCRNGPKELRGGEPPWAHACELTTIFILPGR